MCGKSSLIQLPGDHGVFLCGSLRFGDFNSCRGQFDPSPYSYPGQFDGVRVVRGAASGLDNTVTLAILSGHRAVFSLSLSEIGRDVCRVFSGDSVEIEKDVDGSLYGMLVVKALLDSESVVLESKNYDVEVASFLGCSERMVAQRDVDGLEVLYRVGRVSKGSDID